jgi:hypothetical protein
LFVVGFLGGTGERVGGRGERPLPVGAGERHSQYL